MGTQEIEVPKDIEEDIQRLITSRPELGYKSVREFVITACFLQILRKREEDGE
jgi:hypothetical protein